MENLPKKKLSIYLHILIVSLLLFFSHWIYQFLFFSDDLIVKVLFFGGSEGQLYTYIKYLSSIDFNNSYSAINTELKNVPIPFGSLLFHSIFFKLFGDAGLIIIDFFGIFIFILIFYSIFQIFFSESASFLFAFFLYCLPSLLTFLVGENFVYLTQLTNDFYNLRVHRPFPSSLYLYGFILALSLIYHNKFNKNKLYITLGILLGLLFSSFYYFFVISSIAFIFYLINYSNSNLPNFLKENKKSFVFFILSFFVTIIPFSYFLYSSEPDLLTASGVFELSASKKKFLILYFFEKYFDLKFLLLNFTILIVYISINIFYKKYKNLLKIFLIFYLSSIISPILFILISPKLGLIYHFSNSILLLGYLFLIISSFIIFYEITKRFDYKFNYLVIISILLIFVTIDLNKNIQSKNDIDNLKRLEFQDVSNLIDKKKLSDGKDSVLLTFDVSFMDWSVVKNKFKVLNLVYSTLTPRSFIEIENNIIDVFHFFKLNRIQFETFIENRKINGRLYNPNIQNFMYMKYTANTLNRYENSMDFSDEEIEFIMNTSPLLSKQLAIPIYEKERLLDKFSNTKSNSFIKPSVIIFEKFHELYDKISIDYDVYCKVYSKEIYEVIILKKLNKCID